MRSATPTFKASASWDRKEEIFIITATNRFLDLCASAKNNDFYFMFPKYLFYSISIDTLQKIWNCPWCRTAVVLTKTSELFLCIRIKTRSCLTPLPLYFTRFGIMSICNSTTGRTGVIDDGQPLILCFCAFTFNFSAQIQEQLVVTNSPHSPFSMYPPAEDNPWLQVRLVGNHWVKAHYGSRCSRAAQVSHRCCLV